jgi:hypothetical protein
MTRIIFVTLSAFAFAGLSANGQTPPAPTPVQAEREVVTNQLDSACQAEIARGHCTGEKVGQGLRRCIHAARPLSPQCKQAMQNGNAEMKAAKGH